jgi:hypothetical protein
MEAYSKEVLKGGKTKCTYGGLQGIVVTVDAPIISLACDASSHSVAVGTELHEHNASIVIWCVPLDLLF